MIIIDAGHGGKDPGAVNKAENLFEKDLNLKIALGVGKELELQNHKVFYTRKDDTFISLEDRLLFIRKQKPKLAISFHINSHTTKTANGFETFIRFKKWYGYQHIIHQKLLVYLYQYKIWNRGEKEGNFIVLNNPDIPSILVENLFISNEYEAKLLKDSNFIKGLIISYAEALKTAYGVI